MTKKSDKDYNKTIFMSFVEQYGLKSKLVWLTEGICRYAPLSLDMYYTTGWAKEIKTGTKLGLGEALQKVVDDLKKKTVACKPDEVEQEVEQKVEQMVNQPIKISYEEMYQMAINQVFQAWSVLDEAQKGVLEPEDAIGQAEVLLRTALTLHQTSEDVRDN